jgi:hypothetical protein
VEQPELGGFATRLAADTATREIGGPVDSESWQAARTIVLSYVQGRQAAMHCIADLRRRSLETEGTRNDLQALRINAESLTEFWTGQSKFEIIYLLRLLDREIGRAEEQLPYS